MTADERKTAVLQAAGVKAARAGEDAVRSGECAVSLGKKTAGRGAGSFSPAKLCLMASIFACAASLARFSDAPDFTVFGYRLMIDPQSSTCVGEHHVFLVDTRDRTPARGELFAFVSHDTGFYPDGQIMIKIMAGIPGDQVVVTTEDTRVNGHVAAVGLDAAVAAGADPRAFERALILDPGELFMVGSSRLSLDSRYWRNAYEKDLLGRAYVLY